MNVSQILNNFLKSYNNKHETNNENIEIANNSNFSKIFFKTPSKTMTDREYKNLLTDQMKIHLKKKNSENKKESQDLYKNTQRFSNNILKHSKNSEDFTKTNKSFKDFLVHEEKYKEKIISLEKENGSLKQKLHESEKSNELAVKKVQKENHHLYQLAQKLVSEKKNEKQNGNSNKIHQSVQVEIKKKKNKIEINENLICMLTEKINSIEEMAKKESKNSHKEKDNYNSLQIKIEKEKIAILSKKNEILLKENNFYHETIRNNTNNKTKENLNYSFSENKKKKQNKIFKNPPTGSSVYKVLSIAKNLNK